jgi:hypothetical protein
MHLLHRRVRPSGIFASECFLRRVRRGGASRLASGLHFDLRFRTLAAGIGAAAATGGGWT